MASTTATTATHTTPVEHLKEADRFFWTYTEEPHRTRRQAIVKAHPEVGAVRLGGEEATILVFTLLCLERSYG